MNGGWAGELTHRKWAWSIHFQNKGTPLSHSSIHSHSHFVDWFFNHILTQSKFLLLLESHTGTPSTSCLRPCMHEEQNVKEREGEKFSEVTFEKRQNWEQSERWEEIRGGLQSEKHIQWINRIRVGREQRKCLALSLSQCMSLFHSVSLWVRVCVSVPLGKCSLYSVSKLHQRDVVPHMQMAGRRETEAELQTQRHSAVYSVGWLTGTVGCRFSQMEEKACLWWKSRCERDATRAPCCLHIINSANSF